MSEIKYAPSDVCSGDYTGGGHVVCGCKEPDPIPHCEYCCENLSEEQIATIEKRQCKS